MSHEEEVADVNGAVTLWFVWSNLHNFCFWVHGLYLCSPRRVSKIVTLFMRQSSFASRPRRRPRCCPCG